MKHNLFMENIGNSLIRKDIPDFRPGDTLAVHLRIPEEEKERIQVFTGTLISCKGAALSKTITLYAISYGAGVERVFLLHSPRIAKIEVVKKGMVRKSKLYYLRGSFGKAAKVKERIGGTKNR